MNFGTLGVGFGGFGRGGAGAPVGDTTALIWESNDFDTGWTFSGATVTTSTTLTDDSAVASEYAQRLATVVAGVPCVQIFHVTKDAVSNRFVGLDARDGANIYLTHLNTSTGAVADELTTLAGGTTQVTDMSTYWLVRRTVTLVGTSLTTRIHPARGTVFGSLNNGALGSATVPHVEIRQ